MKTRNRRAFTLVELLVVIAIIAAITALVLPGLMSRGAVTSVADAEEMFTSAVTMARARSARSGQASSIRLRTDRQGRIEIVVCECVDGDASETDSSKVASASKEPEEIVGVIRPTRKNGSTGSGSSGEASAQQSPAAMESSTAATDGSSEPLDATLAVFTPDGSVHPAPPTPIQIGNEGAMLKVAVDGFGVVRIHERSTQEGLGEFDGDAPGFDEQDPPMDVPRVDSRDVGRPGGRLGLR
jgi:prepilin-type N-terminal cleavage/methylation domain-containing protein